MDGIHVLCVGKDELIKTSFSHKEELNRMSRRYEQQMREMSRQLAAVNERLYQQQGSKVTHHSHSSCDNSSN